MALRKVKGNLERIFDKNLTDLVRGIRNNKDNETKYIAQCIEEIKEELRQENISVKANAVAKLTYLQMLGYDISWAAFNVIEVMSSTKFTFKRIGYLAASQSFHEETEVLMLTTNMIRKDLNSQNMYDAGTAMSGFSCFVTPDLARDLANDVMTLLSSTKPYLRKKAILLMYKIFLKFPEALRPAFPRLKEKLEDPDPGVQSAAVNVICELARKNPKNYLSLAPVFFKLMTSSSNNWMLIKIIKLFGALTPLEPRLGKKLIEPLTNLIHSTSAMSLLYECINTVIAVLISISSGMPNHSASIQLCVQKLRILIEDSDQNLKYLGLLAMSKILKTHPKSVQAHKDLVLQCLDDKDESIRLRALDLLYGMVSKKNLMEIVKKLMTHMDKAEGAQYRDELLSKIIDICSQNNYQYITNFEWYVSILVELTKIQGTKHGSIIAAQMLDVAIRVQAIRSFAVSQMAILLKNAQFLQGSSDRNSISEVLYAAAWICGEFSEMLSSPVNTLEAMMDEKVMFLPSHIQSILVQNALKLYARVIELYESEQDIEQATVVSSLLLERMPMFVQSADLEVQERACCVLHLVKQISKLQAKGEKVAPELLSLFTGELNPVAPKAQKKVPVPDGLDLDAWINEPPSEDEGSYDEGNSDTFGKFNNQLYVPKSNQKSTDLTEEDMEKCREARMFEQANNPHYLKASKKNTHVNADDIPVVELDCKTPLNIPGLTSSENYHNNENKILNKKQRKLKRKKKSKNSKNVESEEDVSPLHVVNITEGEMPDGARSSDDDDGGNPDDPHRALNIDLEEPLNNDVQLLPPAQESVNNHEEKTVKVSSKHKHKKERKEKERSKKSKDSSGHKSKRHKKEKKHKEQEHNLSQLPQDQTKDKAEYEEAPGIVTPSKERFISPVTPMTPSVSIIPTCKSLVKDTNIAVTYEKRIMPGSRNELSVILFLNNCSSFPIKDVEITLLESFNVKLIKEQNEPDSCIKVPFSILPEAVIEQQVILSVDNIALFQSVRGTLTYIIKNPSASSHEKLDFKLELPASSFMIGEIQPRDTRDTLSELLGSNDLSARDSVMIDILNLDFNHIIAKICFHCHFFVVEQYGDSASLYSHSIQGDHVCLLVKYMEPQHISVDAKGTNSTLTTCLLEEIKKLFSSKGDEQ
ncbi:AP-3 complex subunit delta-1 isoform X1 [Parasteatoda tepidariorum]|uniref:AP-3 complex subunit delta-1 isoform X1 n=2 Tax=Entelegynae TaxID=74971 RepID=A0A2L2YBF4_PARTP|nr:AP-3 complex subunit delta-1 [Parasteatoda tepidariorum]